MKAALTGVGSVVLVLLAAGCAQPPESMQARPTYGQLRVQLDDHLDGCTLATGSDPFEPSDAGDYELLPNERAWLDCAYDGVETIMIPNTAVPDMYRRLIAESRALTDLVERGEVSRQQRKARIDALVDDIEDAEIGSLVQAEPELSAEQQRAREEQVRKSLDNVRVLAFPRGLR